MELCRQIPCEPRFLSPDSLRYKMQPFENIHKLTKLFHIWIKIYTCYCISVALEMPFKRWILLQIDKDT